MDDDREALVLVSEHGPELVELPEGFVLRVEDWEVTGE